MLYRIKTIDGTKKKVPLAGSTPAGLPVGSILTTYKKIQPYNYLYCDGSTFDETQYPELYLYLGTNVLPDYRECVPVGAEKNTTDIFDSTETDPSTGLPGTQSHDVFSQGEFKDDQLQGHYHRTPQYYEGAYGADTSTGGRETQFTGRYANTEGVLGARTGTTTRTKEKAVYYYIKAVDGVDIADENTFLNTVVNTIQDAQSYSTTEEKTGGKWIDGKDIYRKVVIGSVTGNGQFTISTGLSNFDCIQINGTIKDSGNAISPIPYAWHSGVNANISLFINSNGEIKLGLGSDYGGTRNYRIVIEYTKNE